MKKLNVLYLTNIPSPYMVDFLNELGKKCNLIAIFERDSSGVRDHSWRMYRFKTFKGIVLSGKNIKVNDELDDQAICPQIIKYIKKNKYDAIVVSNPCTPTGIIAIMYMKIRKIPYAIQSEGGFAKNGKGIKERFKKFIMSNAALYLSTAEIGDDYFIQYGATKDKIRKYPFTSLYEAEILKKQLSYAEKQVIKRELQMPYEKVVISIGRFIPVKGFDVFIKACSKLDKSIGIYIIGGEPTDEYLLLRNGLNMMNLHYVSHLRKEDIKKYYLAADFFVLNSRGDTWGLVINEAMSFGLPVISSNQCYAALALIENNKNGYIIEVDNENQILEKMQYLINNPEVCNMMSLNNIKKMEWYTLEQMAETEIEILEEMYNEKL